MKKLLYDVEVFPNVFLCSFKDYITKEIITYEISNRRNQYRSFKTFMSSYNEYLISFNGIHYDNCIVLWVIQNEYILSTLGVEEFLLQLKSFSDMVINNEFWYHDKKLSKYKYHNQWLDIDLYCYWSKMLRLSKKISLKGLAIQLNYDTIQELPFHPNTYLNSQEIDKLANYNRVHDLNILELLLLEKIKEVKLRIYIQKEYKLPCLSFDAPKIASELLIKEYCKLTNENPKEIKGLRFYHESKLPLPSFTFVLPVFQELYNNMQKAFNEFEQEIVLLHNNTSLKISYGKGGIHSVNKNELYEETDTDLIITSDVASLYPTLLINYKLFRYKEILDIYTNVKNDRIEAKRTKNKTKDTLLKLILNSTSGLIDNIHSPLYYPEGAMKLRLTGQLLITLVIERLVLNNFNVISTNTDGIETIVPRNREQEYYDIVDQVGKEYNLIFEHELYKKIVYMNVNSYIAQTSSKIKQKGLFVENPELSNSVNFLIIPKALKAYYIDGTDYRTFIKKHTNIFDFCCSKKIDKSFTVTWTSPDGTTSIQQRLNRYYASTKGGYLMKNKGDSQSHLLKDSGIMIYNNHNPNTFPNDINYVFYINQVREIINSISYTQQLKLF